MISLEKRACQRLIHLIIVLVMLPQILFAAQDDLPDYADSMLNKLIDQKVTIERHSGKKVKGILRAVDNGYLHIELKDSSISPVKITNIKKIKRPGGGALSGFGGVLAGVCVGTGAFFLSLILIF